MSKLSAKQLDEHDVLANCRAEFSLPEDIIYLDGNSLGPLPLAVKTRVQNVLDHQWGTDLIASWNKHHWFDLPSIVGSKIAPLIGADQGQVICCDSISINLFKLLAAAIKLRPGRNLIVSQRDNFPTDLYAAQGLSKLLGPQHCQLKMVDADAIIESIDENVAVLLLTHVSFRSGEKHDMHLLTKIAQEKGALVIWDLAHSAGAVPLQLDKDNVDFAVGCGYKFINGGPGAPAFIYAAHRHLSEIKQPLSGWMGDKAPFEFKDQHRPCEGIEKFLSGTPNIISMSALDAALDLFSNVDLQDLWDKSAKLSEFFRLSVDSSYLLKSLTLVSPIQPSLRGSQLAYTHRNAFAISQALIDRKVIVDFRAPNIIRFGFAPLFTRFRDLSMAIQRLESIINEEVYKDAKYQTQQKVT